jgi:formate hydrogenlyase subunit 3/multisubunit Na+/H+ antiporter MnhD subunit
MASAIIFAGHLIFVLYIFTKKWQEDSLSSAFINLALIVILFSVGWSISTSLVNLVFEPKGFGLYFNRDDISLTFLSIAEFLFYRMYYRDDRTDILKNNGNG